MKIYPSNDVLASWEQIYVPNRDIFFISKKLLEENSELFLDTLNFERKQFFQHSEYNTLQYNNFYGYWNITKKFEYCIVAMPGWYEQLETDIQQKILEEQIESKSYSVINNEYILTNNKWDSMSTRERHEYFNSTLKTLNDKEVLDIPDMLPNYIKEVANTYSKLSGSNCFGVVLFTITKNSWFLNEWVYAENLMWTMEEMKYIEISEEPFEGDILVWYQDNEPFHAAVCVGDNLYLNKNSQMIWSPTKLVTLKTINNDFEDMIFKVFRQD